MDYSNVQINAPESILLISPQRLCKFFDATEQGCSLGGTKGCGPLCYVHEGLWGLSPHLNANFLKMICKLISTFAQKFDVQLDIKD